MATLNKRVEDYEHRDATRLNNPPAGLAREDVEGPPSRPFRAPVDPRLPPELNWAGKDSSDEFEVEAPSIHVHESLTTEAIVSAVRREPPQPALFADPELDRSQAVDFYAHEGRWANRLILGDSHVVMTSLLERERMAGRVQTIYIDPPYGINFNSNFQARVSDRSPTETRDTTLTREPEQIQAYRDTWELGIHSYLTYLRERLVVARELLADSGSVFVQIGPENVHRVRLLLDEVLGPDNACTQIVATTTSGLGARLLPDVHTHLLWYAKDRSRVKYRQLYAEKRVGGEGAGAYTWVELADGTRRRMSGDERRHPSLLPEGARAYRVDNLTSQGFRPNTTVAYEFEGQNFHPGANRCWQTTREGLDRLAGQRRLQPVGRTLGYVRFIDDFPGIPLKNVWTDMVRAGFGERKRYVVETVPKLVARCLLMTTDPGDLVLDPTCGAGTAAYVAEQYGRRWITCDTSRVAVAIARERVLTATYPYYALRDPDRGVDAGLRYRTLSWTTLRSVAHGHDPEPVALHDQPIVEPNVVRVSGPFTFEALSRYAIDPLEPAADDRSAGAATAAEDHVAVLLDALRAHGIPRRGGSPAKVVQLAPLAGAGAIHAEGTFLDEEDEERRFAVSLGPRFGPVTVAQVDEALADAYGYELVIFAGFAATAEAQGFLASGRRGRFGVALLEANPDLLLGDLLKATKASQTFRLFASPDVELVSEPDGKARVRLHGMDLYDTATGQVTSRERTDIAAWLLDQDYDGLVFHVNQAFFTRDNAWEGLERALRGSVDPEAVEQLHSFESLPFEVGASGKVAVRVVDDAGSTSESVLVVDAAPNEPRSSGAAASAA